LQLFWRVLFRDPVSGLAATLLSDLQILLELWKAMVSKGSFCKIIETILTLSLRVFSRFSLSFSLGSLQQLFVVLAIILLYLKLKRKRKLI